MFPTAEIPIAFIYFFIFYFIHFFLNLWRRGPGPLFGRRGGSMDTWTPLDPPLNILLRSGYSSVSFVWGIRVRVSYGQLGLGLIR